MSSCISYVKKREVMNAGAWSWTNLFLASLLGGLGDLASASLVGLLDGL